MFTCMLMPCRNIHFNSSPLSSPIAANSLESNPLYIQSGKYIHIVCACYVICIFFFAFVAPKMNTFCGSYLFVTNTQKKQERSESIRLRLSHKCVLPWNISSLVRPCLNLFVCKTCFFH